MDKNVHPVAAAFFVIIAIVGIGTWFWGTGEAKRFGGPAGLTVNAEGHLFIQIDNQLIEHDENGNFVERHDLGELGVELLLGGTVFFSNGDILLRRGPDTRTFLDNLRAYQRHTNQNALSPDAEGAGLYRCNLRAKTCDSFSNPPIDLKAAFSAFVDLATDTVYISDSSRHLIRKYSADGVELASPGEGYRFPNQLMIADGVLLIADTNHHRIRAVDFRDEAFGDEVFQRNIVPAVARGNDQEWPSYFVQVGDQWWVNNMKTGMNYGGIYAFDSDWEFDRQIHVPGIVDPIALIRFNDEVLISDWYGDRVHRVSLDGERLGNFHSEGLIAVLDEFEIERQHYNVFAWVAAGLAAMLCIVILLKGTDWTGRSPKDDDSDLPPDSGEPVWLKPDPANVERMRSALRSVRYLTIPIVLLIGGLIAFTGFSESEVQLTLGGLGFLAVFLLADWMTRISTNTAIYVDGDRVLLKNHTGRESRASVHDVLYSDNMVATEDMAIFLGQGEHPIYDKEHVLSVLRGRLPASQRISQWEIQKRLIAMRHPYGLVTILALLVVVIVAIMEFSGVT